jgi:hypothetical protein
MRRAILILFLMGALVGVIPLPGLGAISFFFAPFVAALWMAVEVARHGRPGEAVLQPRHGQFLGPGGPDDPFAGEGVDEGERSARLSPGG